MTTESAPIRTNLGRTTFGTDSELIRSRFWSPNFGTELAPIKIPCLVRGDTTSWSSCTPWSILQNAQAGNWTHADWWGRQSANHCATDASTLWNKHKKKNKKVFLWFRAVSLLGLKKKGRQSANLPRRALQSAIIKLVFFTKPVLFYTKTVFNKQSELFWVKLSEREQKRVGFSPFFDMVQYCKHSTQFFFVNQFF